MGTALKGTVLPKTNFHVRVRLNQYDFLFSNKKKKNELYDRLTATVTHYSLYGRKGVMNVDGDCYSV